VTSIAPPSHTRRPSTSDSWITPRWLLDRLGPFDLDPCSSDPQPWPTATRMLTRVDDGLLSPWEGLVFMNCPYGRQLGKWLARLAAHPGGGIALVFARTETAAFRDHVWPFATSLLFLYGRLTFFLPDGTTSKAGHNSGGPSVLIAYGTEADARLAKCSDLGAFVRPVKEVNYGRERRRTAPGL